jgi:hypothetical protein
MRRLTGGGGGIRTPETLSGLTVFKTAGFNRSPTPPFPIITSAGVLVTLLTVIAAFAATVIKLSQDCGFFRIGVCVRVTQRDRNDAVFRMRFLEVEENATRLWKKGVRHTVKSIHWRA